MQLLPEASKCAMPPASCWPTAMVDGDSVVLVKNLKVKRRWAEPEAGHGDQVDPPHRQSRRNRLPADAIKRPVLRTEFVRRR